MPTLSMIEEGYERKEVTLVVHPVIRRAMHGYEDSFHIGVRCFLNGEGDGVFFLPLESGGYPGLQFANRCRGFSIERIAFHAALPQLTRIRRL